MFKKWSLSVLVIYFLMSIVLLGCGSPLLPPIVKSTGGRIRISQYNRSISLARNGKIWGAVWIQETYPNRMHIDFLCKQAIYFMIFDDNLNLLLDKPIRLMRKDCSRINLSLVSTEKGFAVSHSDIGAEFDLASKKFIKNSTFPKQEKKIISKLKVPGLCSRPYSRHVLECTFSNDSRLRVWAEYCPIMERKDKKVAGQIRYMFTSDNENITSVGNLIPIKEKERYGLKLKLLRTGKTISLFIKKENKIFRQRFNEDGKLLGKTKAIVIEQDWEKTKYPQDGKNICNLNIGVINSNCVILYTRGNTGMKVYNCKTRKKRYIGEGSALSMYCTKSRCLIISGRTVIEYLKY